MSLADPGASSAVLIGCDAYRDLESLPAVANNLEGLRRALCDPGLWGLAAERCVVLTNPVSAGEVLDVVHTVAATTSEMLLVYFAGHGLLDPVTSELYLATVQADEQTLHRAVRYDDLRRVVLGSSRALAKVMVLDCCYSGAALVGGMSAATVVADHAGIEGTYLMAASGETKLALAPVGERYTAFTGELLEVLDNGMPGGPDLLDLDTLYFHLRRELQAKGRPIPQQRARNGGRAIVLARNRWALDFGEYYERHGGAGGWLGLRIGGPASAGPSQRKPGTTGRCQRFEGGVVYTTGQGPAIGVRPPIVACHEQFGGVKGLLGFPVTDETHAAASRYGTTGTYQRFEDSFSYPQDILDRWSSPAGWVGATIYASSAFGAYCVRAGVGALYERMGGTAGWLGFPKSGEIDGRTSPDRQWRCFQRFEGGVIFWTAKHHAVAVSAAVASLLFESPEIGRQLGFPTSAEREIAAAENAPGEDKIQFFEHGIVTTHNGTAQAWLEPAQLLN